MATFTKQLLSGSTNGKAIAVAATGTPGTTIHTAVSGTTDFDEIWLWAVNTDTSERKLTLEMGGTAASDNIEVYLPPEAGLILICPGLLLQNSLVLKAFASVTNVINIIGFVNRIAA